MGFYTALTGVGAQGLPAVTAYYGAWGQKPIILPIDPWFQGHVLELPSSKLVTNVPIAIHNPQVENWQGRWVFGGRSSGMLTVTRGARTIGAHMTLIGPSSEIDFTGWSQAPDSIATTIGNMPPLAFAYLLNGAYSGTPQDAAGNAVNISGMHPCRDQIYGGAPAAVTPNVNSIAILTGGTRKPANPGDASVGTPWWNAHENFDGGNPQNYLAVFNNLNIRPAYNGVPLMLAAKPGLKMLVAPDIYENDRVMFVVMQELANSGAFESIQYTPVGATIPQVVFGRQPNPMYGRMVIEPVPGLRSDLRVILAAPLNEYPQSKPFLYPHGGKMGEYKVQTAADLPTNDSVPHLYVKMFDVNSGLYEGLHDGMPAGTIGMGWIINEGYAWASGLLCEFLYTGSAS
jgi:hypothetical protein